MKKKRHRGTEARRHEVNIGSIYLRLRIPCRCARAASIRIRGRLASPELHPRTPPCLRARVPSCLRPAFTLVELMVVVVIIGVLATVVTISVTDYLVTGKQTAARNEIAQMGNALELFYMDNDRYPTNDEGLAKLKEKTSQHPNGLLQGDLLDPWNHPYVYIHPGLHGKYDIASHGADGHRGGQGANADILSWNLSGAETR